MLADIISVLSMAYGKENSRDTLKYRLLGERGDIEYWGHEYVKHLAMEIGQEYREVITESSNINSELSKLIDEVLRFFLDHNAEPDAVDLLICTEQMPRMIDALKESDDIDRVCLYVLSCVPFEAYPDDTVLLKTVHTIYRSRSKFPEALSVSIRMNSPEMIKEDFDSCSDPSIKKQLAFMLARQRIPVDVASEELQSIFNNSILSKQFQNLAKELEILEPKVPEDIYKSHLQDSLRVPVKMDTARQNLASVFVNAFVNTAFCKDKLMNAGCPEAQESNSWIYKTKESGLISAVASIGALNLWNVDQGLNELDKYLESENVFIKSGALLGIGLLHTNIRNESDPAWALLREHLESDDEHIKSNALLGLALAYGGSGRADIAETLLPLIGDSSVTVASMAALALGHVFVGTCEGEVASCIIQTMMERDAFDLNKPVARFLCLGLALLFTGKHEASEAIVETLRCIEHPIGQDAIVLVQACAFAASGNVLKIQEMLQTCTIKAENEAEAEEETEKESGDEVKSSVSDSFEKGHLSYAVIAIALISIAEDIGQEMSLRIFSHLMYYGTESIRKAVPLALGVLYASHPTVNIMDILSKYSHDHDKAVAVNAILAMGLVGAGTNHAKLAQMLRQLSSYYQRDSDCLFMVRIAQGLLHLGKGTMAVAPLYSQKSVLSPTGLAGLLTVLIAATDAQHLLMDTSTHGGTAHLLYFIIAAMYPRFLYCLDADSLESLPVLVRVGQAVEVVGQAGKPKSITGFQTHTTPVLIAYGERAELATEEYIALSPILENFVLVRKNPDYQEE